MQSACDTGMPEFAPGITVTYEFPVRPGWYARSGRPVNRRLYSLEKYIYSERNRLNDPHSYMYSEFGGRAFLEGYLDMRLAIIRRQADIKPGAVSRDDATLLRVALPAVAGQVREMGTPEKEFLSLVDRLHRTYASKPEEETGAASREVETHATEQTDDAALPEPGEAGSVHTESLLRSLVATLAGGPPGPGENERMDRLLHRFEISKKIHPRYDSGLKKGKGEPRDARLYWLFSLALLLHFLRNGRMKYASSMLKVNDLLCSLPGEKLAREIPYGGLALLLSAEVECIQHHIKKRGVYATR